MTTIQVTGVQHPTGRKTEHVRVFGHIEGDLLCRVVEVCVRVEDAADLIRYADAHKAFPQIEVDSNVWIRCLNTGDLQIVHLRGTDDGQS